MSFLSLKAVNTLPIGRKICKLRLVGPFMAHKAGDCVHFGIGNLFTFFPSSFDPWKLRWLTCVPGDHSNHGDHETSVLNEIDQKTKD